MLMRPNLEDDMYRGNGTVTTEGLIDFSHVRGGGAWLARDPARVGPVPVQWPFQSFKSSN